MHSAVGISDDHGGEDVKLMRAAGLKRKQLHARAEAWRPWRAYSAHYLWQSLGVVP